MSGIVKNDLVKLYFSKTTLFETAKRNAEIISQRDSCPVQFDCGSQRFWVSFPFGVQEVPKSKTMSNIESVKVFATDEAHPYMRIVFGEGYPEDDAQRYVKNLAAFTSHNIYFNMGKFVYVADPEQDTVSFVGTAAVLPFWKQLERDSGERLEVGDGQE